MKGLDCAVLGRRLVFEWDQPYSRASPTPMGRGVPKDDVSALYSVGRSRSRTGSH